MNKNTTLKVINGATFDGNKIHRQKVIVRYTDDERGKTLSLQAQDIMIIVRFEEIEEVIIDNEKQKNDTRKH